MNFLRHQLGFWEPETSKDYVPSYPAAGNARCFEIEARSHWFRARNRILAWALRRVGFPGGFLDVGGGNGYQLKFLQDQVLDPAGIYAAMCEPGVDGCVNAVHRGVHNVYHCASASFPFAQNPIGGVGLFDVIEHVPEDSELLLAIARDCVPRSRFFITVPAGKHLWSSVDDYAGHFRRYDRKEADRLVQETGFKRLLATRFFSYYAPMVWGLRVLPEMFRRPYSTEEVVAREAAFHQGSRSRGDFALERLHRAELGWLDLGGTLTVGTSLLLVLESPG